MTKAALDIAGWELHRRNSGELPFIQSIACAGQTFDFWIANQHTRDWWGKPVVESDAEIGSLAGLVMPLRDAIVFDVGAHHGFFTLLFSRWAGTSGEVHAFEASSDNAAWL